jgi:hypothetical protein
MTDQDLYYAEAAEVQQTLASRPRNKLLRLIHTFREQPACYVGSVREARVIQSPG